MTYERGLHLPDHGLWLDPQGARERAFVSHAHSDHTAKHARIVATPATARLMRLRLGGRREEELLDFDSPREMAGGRVTLLPAGHVLGSAQFLFESGAGSLLYTGDLKLRPGAAVERARWCRAETLVMETTFGLPRYRLPPDAEVRAAVTGWCQQVLDSGGVPVLLAYSLGKAQELLCALRAAALPVMLHAAVWDVSEVYRELWPGFPAGYARFRAGRARGHVVIWPPTAARAELAARVPEARFAVATGWAVEPGAVFRYQCEAAFPLSDHADYDDLLRYVELVQPRRVLTLHGFAAQFAADLRRRGVEAWALTSADQLELGL